MGKDEKDSNPAIYSLDVLDTALDSTGEMENRLIKISNDEILEEGNYIPSPDGHQIAIIGEWNVYAQINTVVGGIKNAPMPIEKFYNWFPDNQRILYGQGALVLADMIRGEDADLVVPDYGSILGAAASPDGENVVYSNSKSDFYTSGIWMVNSNGQNAHLLVEGVSAINFSWSPDGKKIAFWGNGLQIMDADGSNLRKIAPKIQIPLCYFLPPVWSPDSQKLAIVSSQSGDSFCHGWAEDIFSGTNIYIVDVNSGEARPILSEDDTGNIDPAWSPDGSRIAFVSNRDGSPEIWTMSMDGSNLRRLTENHFLVRFPFWRNVNP